MLCLSTWTIQAQTTLGETNCLDFDGTDDFVSIPDNGTLDFASGSTFTLETWTNWKGQNNNGDGTCVFFDKTQFTDQANYRFYVVEPGGANANKIGFWNGSSNVFSTGTVPLNTWTHVALVYDNTTYTFYINGTASGTGTHSAGAVNNGAVFLGKDNTQGREMYGALDEMRIWNVARTSTQIMASYRGELCGSETGLVAYYDFNQGIPGGNNSGISMVDDKTSNNNDGTLTNFAKTGSSSNFLSSDAIQQNSLDFDGTNDEITLGEMNALDNVGTFTIETWIKETEKVGTNAYFWSTGNSANDNMYFVRQTSNNRWFLNMTTGGSSAQVIVTAAINADWTHFAIVYDGSEAAADRVKIYFDGVAQSTTISGTVPTTTPTVSGDFLIGISSWFNLGDNYDGIMDEFRIWSTARTAGEISANMNDEITSNTSDLIAYYKMNQGNADQTNTNVTTLVDLSENCNHGTLTNFGLSTGSTSNWTGGAPELLPVEMTYFRGRAVNNGTLLTWQTASEINNKGFEIERSDDGYNWENIGFINGRGTTYEISNYQFTDTKPHKKLNYYRLKQTDYDGAFEYSEVVSVQFAAGSRQLAVYPNPTQTGEVTLYIPNADLEDAQLEIFNTVGQLVRTEVLNFDKINIRTNDLLKGMYLFSVKVNGQTMTERVVIR